MECANGWVPDAVAASARLDLSAGPDIVTVGSGFLRSVDSSLPPSPSWSWLPRRFAPTRWSLVRRLGQGAQDRASASEELCRIYWYPLYACLRKRGYSEEVAQDYVQSFMLKVLDKGVLDRIKEGRGRLRGYLVKLLDRHVASEHVRAGARKRGGGMTMISFEAAQAEQWLNDSLRTDALSPDDVLRRALAFKLFDEALVSLRRRYEACGRSALLEELLPALEGPLREETYGDVATRVGMTPGAVKTEANRMRGYYSKALMASASVALQLPPGPELDAELRQLFGVDERPDESWQSNSW